MKKYLSTILLCILCACGSSAKNNSLPQWYIFPKQNNLVNLYGVGEGYTLEEATNAALKNLASKLMVTISAETSTLLEENNFGINEESRQKINEVVEKITFTNYAVSTSANINGKIYAEISVDRDNFIKECTYKISDLNQKMKDIYKNLANKNILEKRNGLAKILDMAAQATQLNYIVVGLDNAGFDKKKNLDQYSFYQQSLNQVLDKIEFYIELNDSPKSVGSAISKALSKEKMKVVKSKDIDNLNLVVINIKSDLVTNNIYGANIAKLKINLELLSNRNKVLANNLIEVTGNSVTSKDEAISAASSELSEKINQEGILKILSIN